MSGMPTAAEGMLLLRMASPLVVLFAAAAAALVASALDRDEESGIGAWIAIAGLAASFALAWMLWPEAGGERIAMLAIDRLSLVAWMITAAAGLFAAALSQPYAASRGIPRGDYFALLLFACFGMGVLAAAGDLVAILVGLETMSLAAYALTGSLRGDPRSVEGALKYFLMGAFATAFFAMGIAFLVGSAGTTDLALLAGRAADVAAGEGRAFFLFGCAMASVGFAFKVAAVPFHAWAPDAYDGAPTPVAALMATGVKAAAVVAFARLAIAAAAYAGPLWHHLAWALAAATMVVGNLAAIRQENVKRMLAYSSIAHAGYLLVAFPAVLVDPVGALRAILVYLVAYVVMTAGAFAAVTAIGLARGEPVEVAGLAGLGQRRPWLAVTFALFLVSLAGFPPTLGFFGKYYLFLAAVRSGDVGLVVVAVLASVVSVFYYLRPVVAMYFREAKGDSHLAATGMAPLAPAVVAALAVAAMAVAGFGILPGDLVAFIHSTIPR